MNHTTVWMTATTASEYVVGFVSLVVVGYRIAFFMIPMARDAIDESNWSKLFLSFTLLV